jgi:hypothetical protein
MDGQGEYELDKSPELGRAEHEDLQRVETEDDSAFERDTSESDAPSEISVSEVITARFDAPERGHGLPRLAALHDPSAQLQDWDIGLLPLVLPRTITLLARDVADGRSLPSHEHLLQLLESQARRLLVEVPWASPPQTERNRPRGDTRWP